MRRLCVLTKDSKEGNAGRREGRFVYRQPSGSTPGTDEVVGRGNRDAIERGTGAAPCVGGRARGRRLGEPERAAEGREGGRRTHHGDSITGNCATTNCAARSDTAEDRRASRIEG